MPPPSASISDAVSHVPPDFPTVEKRRTDDLWREAVIAFGLGLTAGWIILLGYGMVHLVKLVL